MKTKRRSVWAKGLAILLAVVFAVTGLMPNGFGTLFAYADTTTTVTITVKDANNQAVSGATISLYKSNADNETAESVTFEESSTKDGTYTATSVAVGDNDELYYTVSKTGYLTSEKKKISPATDNNGNKTYSDSVELSLAPTISIKGADGNDAGTTLTMDSNYTLSVNNPVDGVTYSYAVLDASGSEASNATITTGENNTATLKCETNGKVTLQLKNANNDVVDSKEITINDPLANVTLTATKLDGNGNPVTDNSVTDVKSVQLVLSNVPTGYEGIITWKMIIGSTETEISPIESNTTGSYTETTRTYTYTNDDYLSGNVKFQAVLPADTVNYYSGETISASASYKQSASISLGWANISTTSTEVTYGDTAPTISVTEKDASGDVINGGTGRTMKYTSSNTNVATVGTNGTITIVGAGETTITVSAKENDTYTEASDSTGIKLTVKKKKLPISASNLTSMTWNEGSKIYDGTANATVTGTYTVPSSTDTITITATGTLKDNSDKEITDASDDAYSGTLTITSVKADSNQYDVSFEKNSTTDNYGTASVASYTISRRPVYLAVSGATANSPFTVSYGDDPATKLAASNSGVSVGLAGTNGKISTENTVVQGVVDTEVDTVKNALSGVASLTLDTTSNYNTTANPNRFYVGTHTGVIKVTGVTENPTNETLKNYSFYFTEDTNKEYCGTLKVTAETNITSATDYVDIDTNNSKSFSGSKETTIWVGANSTLAFSAIEAKGYTTAKVRVGDTGDFADSLNANVFSGTDYTNSAVTEVSNLQLQLSNSSDTDGDTVTTISSPGITVKVDKQLPEVTFTNLKTNVQYTNQETYSETIIVSDQEGSGIKNAAYAIVSADTLSGITKASSDDDIINAVATWYQSNVYEATSASTTWQSLSSGSNSITIKGDDGKYYLVIVYAEDEVGNCTLSIENNVGKVNQSGSVSKGLVVDRTQPTVAVKLSYKSDDLKHNKYFNSQRTMTITYTEANFSEDGLTFDVTVDGKKQAGINLSTLKGLTNSGIAVTGPVEDSSTNTYTYTLTFGATSAEHEYQIVPYITDLAGNSNTDTSGNVIVSWYDNDQINGTVVQDFVVDMQAPELTVTYYKVDANGNKDGNALATHTVNSSTTANTATAVGVYNQPVMAVVKITDPDFSKYDSTFSSNIAVTESATKLSGTVGSTTDQNNLAQTYSEWTKTSGAATQEFTFGSYTVDRDAIYAFNLSYTDLAGNTVKLVNTTDATAGDSFTVDVLNTPTSTLTLRSTTFSKLLTAIEKVFFKNAQETIAVTAGDTVSGIKSVSYYLDTLTDDGSSYAVLGVNDLAGKSWTDITSNGTLSDNKSSYTGGSVTVKENEKQALYVRVVDNAGNAQYFNTNGVITDTAAPTITISGAKQTSGDAAGNTVTVGTTSYTYFNTDVLLTLQYADPQSGSVASGVAKAAYSLAVGNGESLESVTFVNRGNTSSDDGYDAGTYIQDTKTYTQPITIHSTDEAQSKAESGTAYFNSNNITLTATAADYAGNTKTETASYIIDTTKPVITTTFDGDVNTTSAANATTCTYKTANTVSGKHYYNANQTMTVKFTERNFDEDETYISGSYRVDGGSWVKFENVKLSELVSGSTIPGVTFTKDDPQSGTAVKDLTIDRAVTYTFTFGKSETAIEYSGIVFSTTDYAKNPTATSGSYSFVIDRDVPVVTASYSNNSAQNDKYFKATRTMTLEIEEASFSNAENYLSFDVYAKDGINGTELNQAAGKTFTCGNNIQNQIGTVSLATLKTLANKNGTYLGISVSEKTDGIKHTYTITFGADGYDFDYKFIPHVVDLAGNSNSNTITYADDTVASTEFTVDMVAPVPSIKFAIADGTDVTSQVNTSEDYQNWYYINQDITATVSVDERNFALSTGTGQNFSTLPAQQMQVTVTSQQLGDDEPTPETVTAYTTQAIGNQWTQSGFVHSMDFVFSTEADYTLGMTYTDLAGNSVTLVNDGGTYKFVVDKTAPTGKITVTSGKANGTYADLILNDPLYMFNMYDNDTITIMFESEDATSIYTQKYYMYNPGDVHGSQTQLTVTGDTASEKTLTGIPVSGWVGDSTFERSINVANQTYSTTSNSEQVPYLRLEDKAGNVVFISSDGVIDDRTEPAAPEITITIAEPAQDIYNQDVPFTITATDPTVNGTYAGLKSVSYEVLNGDTVTQSGNYDADLTDSTARTQTIVKSETVNAQSNNSNHIKIRVTAVDWAGNTSTAEKDLKIDVTKPEVVITYDLNTPSNERYYNATRTATVHVYERNFDPNAVDFTITNTDGTMPAISGWSIGATTGEDDRTENTCTVTFAADGDYTITMNCTDKAGNRSEYTQTDEFTIDQTIPTIQVTFNNNNALNGKYFKEARTATITVNEHNFNGSDVQTAIQASLEAQGISAPGVNGWSTNGDVNTATVSFDKDGDFSFTVNYTDLAGNPAETYTQTEFTIDLTAPTFEFFDVEDKAAYNDEIAPGVVYDDVNYDVNGVSITYSGVYHESEAVDGTRTTEGNGERIKMADFEHDESVDDIYTMTASITDLAGNVTEQEIMFSVNRFGSNYRLINGSQEFVDKRYNNEEQDITIEEINVSESSSEISYGLDGNITNLKANEDYDVDASGNEVSWKSYIYTIPAETFATEGVYNITVNSEDAATNVVNNKAKNVDIEFVIDKTAPEVQITGIEDGATYRTNSREMTITVLDNVAMSSVAVYKREGTDSVLQQEYDAEEIRETTGTLTYELSADKSRQYVKAVAVDMAGNTMDTTEEGSRHEGWVGVMISTNVGLLFINTPQYYIPVIIAAAAIFFLIIFLKRRKKDDEEQQAAQQK